MKIDAVILAGGLGTRLRSVVSDVPKCMASVAGQPFLYHILRQLADSGIISRVILSVGYLKETIQDWVEAHAGEFPFEFDWAVEDEPLGTGGAIKCAMQKVKGERALVMNGDTISDIDFKNLVENAQDSPLTVALIDVEDAGRYGSVSLSDNGRILSFSEKSQGGKALVNAGVYVIDKNSCLFDGLEGRFSFENDVLVPQSRKGNVKGRRAGKSFIDIGIPRDYYRACFHMVDPGDYDTILLDRDGVINVLLPGDYVKTWDEFVFLPGIREAVARWTEKGKSIYIVTNQRGVGKGIFSQEALESIHARMMEEIEKCGGRIDGIYACTAASDDDPRRKPAKGLFDDILRDHPEVDPARTLMLGDSPSDEAFAANCNIKFIKI